MSAARARRVRPERGVRAAPTPLRAHAGLYLLLSCVSLGAAVGAALRGAPRALYVLGMTLVVLSDTLISVDNFLGVHSAAGGVLPTYYLSQACIVASLMLRPELRPRQDDAAGGGADAAPAGATAPTAGRAGYPGGARDQVAAGVGFLR